MSRVLVTGATGFVGRAAADAILRAGKHEVFAASRRPAAGKPGALRPVAVNLFDPVATARVMRDIRPTHLVHAAWYTEPGEYWTSLENLRWVAASLRLLLEFCEQGGRRAVFVGSCAEYDWGADLLSESSPLNPATLYGTAKLSLFRMLEAASRQAKLSAAWARLFFLYGPGERPARFIPSLIRPLLCGQPAICRNGDAERDFMHVSDIGRALQAVLDSALEGAVNVAAGRCVPLGEIARLIGDAVGRRDLLKIERSSGDRREPRRLAADVRRLREEAGFRPEYELARGLEDAIAWWTQRRAA